MIPDFNSNGNLPVGVHWATWDEFIARYVTTPQRRRLIIGLRTGLEALAKAGCQVVYVNGSFVTDKEAPGDFDVCWEMDGVDPTLLDPVLLNFDNQRASQKAKYCGEYFPTHWKAETLPPYRAFLEFFQTDKETGNPKGIIGINLGEWLL